MALTNRLSVKRVLPLLGQGVTTLILFSLIELFTASPARAADEPRVVIEMFTSQSCSSCPPAERVLAELDGRGEILGIEWHVDYWDDLIAGFRGRWEDPFSDPAHTRRQRDYNVRIRGTRSIYTPQMVVAGQAELPGFSKPKVRALVREASRNLKAYDGKIDPVEPGRFRLSLDGPADVGAALWQVTVLPAATTDIQRGENKGKTLDNHNVVRAVRALGEWRGGAHSVDFTADKDHPDASCVILVQEPDLGPVLFGLACPA